MKKIDKWVREIWIMIVSLIIISLAIGFFSPIGYIEAFRIIFGSVYVLFLPGFIISYIFFPKTKDFDSEKGKNGAIDWIERIALSFALSIAIVPLLIFYLNLAGMKIDLTKSFLTILCIIAISLTILRYKYYLSKNDK